MPEPVENDKNIAEVSITNGHENQEKIETDTINESEKTDRPHDSMRNEPILTELIVESYEGEKDQRGFFNGCGSATFFGGHAYSGNFSSGLMHGNGRYIWANGIIYEGSFTENRIEGKGRYTWFDESTYEGEVVNGLRHGQGVFTCSTIPSIYTGEWKEGKRHGTGILRYDKEGKSYYEGHWINNKRHGFGIRRYPSGNIYEGEWKNNCRHGSGVMQWFDRNERYEGQWENGFQQGQGEHSWFVKRIVGSQYPLRNRYVGEWVKGLRHGYGVFYYANGAKYCGEWMNNMKHGKGKYSFKNGMVFEGTFEQDHMLDYPEFSPSGMTTPDVTASGIPLRSATPLRSGSPYLPSDDSGERSKNSLNINISHLQHERHLRPEECEKELQQVVHVLLRFISNLRNIYTFYSGLGRLGTVDNTFVMTRIQFWRFLKDCKIHHLGVTLTEIDRLIDHNKRQTLGGLHYSQQDVLMRDFLNAIVSISYHVFHSQHQGRETLLLPWCVSKLICENILVNSCNVKGSLFANPEKAIEALKYMPKVLDIFQIWCTSGSVSPHEQAIKARQTMKHEQSIKARQFLYMLNDYRLLNDNLTAKEVVQILASDEPQLAGHDFCNMEIELTFLEIFEALIDCATVFVTEAVMNDPLTPKAVSEISSRSQSARSYTTVSKPGDDSPDEGEQDQGTASVAETPSREQSPDRGSRGGGGEVTEQKRMSITTHGHSELPQKDKTPESGHVSQDGAKRASSEHLITKPSAQSLPTNGAPGNEDTQAGESQLSASMCKGSREQDVDNTEQSPTQEQDPFSYWAAQLSIFFERKLFVAADKHEAIKKLKISV